MTFDATFIVPLRPRPKNKLRTAVKKGRVIAFRDPGDKAWARRFAELIAPELPARVIDEDLRLDLAFVFERPETKGGKKLKAPADEWLWHDTRPDEDNLRKAVKDAFAEAWRDDCLVVLGTTLKVYGRAGELAHVRARIRPASQFNPLLVAKQLGLLADAALEQPATRESEAPRAQIVDLFDALKKEPTC